MPRKVVLTFSPSCGEFLENTYSKAQMILEYGSGGSTLLAAKLNKRVVTMDTSRDWLQDLMANHREADYPGHISPLWTDVGITKKWGYPVNDGEWRNWRNYPVAPWRYCINHNLSPDVVLIDGRFRVACFLASCAYTSKPTTVLFDDYAPRRHYHHVAQFIEPSEIIDNHLAVFHIRPGLIDAASLLDHIRYFSNPA